MKILKKQVNKLNDEGSDSGEEHTNDDLHFYAEGSYAKETIEQILQSFKGSDVAGDDETFLQMNDLLEIFYNDPDMNREVTKVRGNDFCEMLGLFFDLTDRIRGHLLDQLTDKEKLQEKYDALLEETTRTVKKPVGGSLKPGLLGAAGPGNALPSVGQDSARSK